MDHTGSECLRVVVVEEEEGVVVGSCCVAQVGSESQGLPLLPPKCWSCRTVAASIGYGRQTCLSQGQPVSPYSPPPMWDMLVGSQFSQAGDRENRGGCSCPVGEEQICTWMKAGRAEERG